MSQFSHKIKKTVIDYGCGFPVRLSNVPMIKVRGTWTPKIDYPKFHENVLRALAYQSSRLTGNQIHFIRLYFEMTLKIFSERFSVKHSAVIKWEQSENKFTKMNWATEKDIRLFILSKLAAKPRAFSDLYLELETQRSETLKTITLEIQPLAA